MITYAQIEKAVMEDPESRGYYKMVLRGNDSLMVSDAVNRGIDSHLEACSVQGRDVYEWKGGALDCRVSAPSLPVLLRRLAETCDEAHLLASDILTSLGIEDDPIFIVSPVDEEAKK